jgi:leucyl aminopeptidase
LVTPDGTDASIVQAFADATALVRDLINAPPNELGPTALSAAAKAVADQFGATFKETVGDDLLTNNYPAIHAVGRAAEDAPRLIEISWGSPDLPTVALVGKGVCFDSGGLDIKSAAGMKLMKKDMGGSAHVLGIAHCVMAMGLKVHLKVLIPAVENAIAGNAMRPGDVVATRAGITVEIGNTDAEGRVILADALTRAGEASPEVVIDCATLTGAARVALGTELPALFCNNDTFADEILAAGQNANDPLWRMPLWPGYRKMIEGKVADITNSPDGGYAGAITAALFLERFAPADAAWAHTDIMAWNLSSKPGRPEGGEAMGMRAFVGALVTRYGKA